VAVNTLITELIDHLEPIVLSDLNHFRSHAIFNIPVENSSDVYPTRFPDVVESMGLLQHVKIPTHEGGPTLDPEYSNSSL